MGRKKNLPKNLNDRISVVLEKLTKENASNNQEVVELLLDIQKKESNKSSGIKYSSLFDFMRESIVIYDADENGNDFQIVNFNTAAEKTSKIKREEIIGEKITEVFPEVLEVGLLSILKSVWETGIPKKHPVATYNGDFITNWKDNFVFKLPSGQIVTAYRDITKQKAAEEKVVRSELNLKSLINNRNESIWSIDAEYNYIIFNDFLKKQYYKVSSFTRLFTKPCII